MKRQVAGGATVQKAANISPCGRYRYSLSRLWADRPLMVFVMLNPSTADADLDDPTIRRCAGFARREGMGGFGVVNLYAYRATRPKALRSCEDPIGPRNDGVLTAVLNEARHMSYPVVAAWGVHASSERSAQVLDLVPNVDWLCLGTTKAGHPRHPLFVRGDQPLVPLRPAAR
ncbi:MAG: hypothetical protein JWP11_3684 [Frankiales bacterium]|nr:hypothetical protein [Frankiales bacterium]